jgi:flagellin-like protein
MNFPEKVRKIQNNAKALSPVVASIILIAVTVAVSIAVAAWMGGLAGGFMQTEQVQINTVSFDATENEIQIEVMNTGTSAITVSSMQVNNVGAAFNTTSTPATIQPNGKAIFILSPDDSTPVTLGNNYQIKVLTSKNSAFTTSAIAA